MGGRVMKDREGRLRAPSLIIRTEKTSTARWLKKVNGFFSTGDQLRNSVDTDQGAAADGGTGADIGGEEDDLPHDLVGPDRFRLSRLAQNDVGHGGHKGNGYGAEKNPLLDKGEGSVDRFDDFPQHGRFSKKGRRGELLRPKENEVQRQAKGSFAQSGPHPFQIIRADFFPHFR